MILALNPKKIIGSGWFRYINDVSQWRSCVYSLNFFEVFVRKGEVTTQTALRNPLPSYHSRLCHLFLGSTSCKYECSMSIAHQLKGKRTLNWTNAPINYGQTGLQILLFYESIFCKKKLVTCLPSKLSVKSSQQKVLQKARSRQSIVIFVGCTCQFR